MTLEVKRGDKVLRSQVAPAHGDHRYFRGQSLGRAHRHHRPEESGHGRVGPVRAFREGAASTLRIAWLTLLSLYKLLAREVPLKNLGGPILIAQVAGKQAELGVALVQFMAVISVNLALLNLLPIPILDGGHLFSLLEAVRRKPVAIKHREMAQGVGLMLILALMFWSFTRTSCGCSPSPEGGMLILALDTATDPGSLALATDAGCWRKSPGKPR